MNQTVCICFQHLPPLKMCFFVFADSSRKHFLRHTGGKQHFCDRVFIVKYGSSEICLKVWTVGNGMGRCGLLGRGQVSCNECVMYQIQTAGLSDILCDYTFSPFIFSPCIIVPSGSQTHSPYSTQVMSFHYLKYRLL